MNELTTPGEVAGWIKLGGDVDIGEYGFTLADMIPFFEHDIDNVAEDHEFGRQVQITSLNESVTFRWNLLTIKAGDALQTEEIEWTD